MTKRLLIVLLIIAAIALIIRVSFEAYRSEWAINSTAMAAISTPGDADDSLAWNMVLVAPLESPTVKDAITNRVLTGLIEALGATAITAEAAPREIRETDDVPYDAALFFTINDWKVKNGLFSRTAKAVVTLDGIQFGAQREKTLRLDMSIVAEGEFSGLVKRSTMENQLAAQISSKVADALRSELTKHGQHLPTAPSADQVARQLKTSKTDYAKLQGSRPAEVTSPTPYPGAIIDYSWQMPHQQILLYRVVETATDLEAHILEDLGYADRESIYFVSSVGSRRKLMVNLDIVSHWPTNVPTSDALGYPPYGQSPREPQDERVERNVLYVFNQLIAW